MCRIFKLLLDLSEREKTGMKVTVNSFKHFQNEVCRMAPGLTHNPQILLRW